MPKSRKKADNHSESGEYLKEIRVRRGFRLAYLAILAGISPGYLSMLENGAMIITDSADCLHTFDRLANALKITDLERELFLQYRVMDLEHIDLTMLSKDDSNILRHLSLGLSTMTAQEREAISEIIYQSNMRRLNSSKETSVGNPG